MHAGKLVVLVFHAKGEHQRPPGGAGRPPICRPAWGVAIWPPPLSGRSGSRPEVGGGCVAPTEAVRGPSSWLWLGSGLRRSGTLLIGPTLLLKLSWVLNLRVVIGFGLNSTWFKPFGLHL